MSIQEYNLLKAYQDPGMASVNNSNGNMCVTLTEDLSSLAQVTLKSEVAHSNLGICY